MFTLGFDRRERGWNCKSVLAGCGVSVWFATSTGAGAISETTMPQAMHEQVVVDRFSTRTAKYFANDRWHHTQQQKKAFCPEWDKGLRDPRASPVASNATVGIMLVPIADYKAALLLLEYFTSAVQKITWVGFSA